MLDNKLTNSIFFILAYEFIVKVISILVYLKKIFIKLLLLIYLQLEKVDYRSTFIYI